MKPIWSRCFRWMVTRTRRIATRRSVCMRRTSVSNGELHDQRRYFYGRRLAWIGLALDDLSDVVITAPAVDDVLIYDGAQWVNSPVPAGSPGSPGGGGELLALSVYRAD